MPFGWPDIQTNDFSTCGGEVGREEKERKKKETLEAISGAVGFTRTIIVHTYTVATKRTLTVVETHTHEGYPI